MVVAYSSYEYNLDTGTWSDTKGCFVWIFKIMPVFEQTSTNSVFTEV